VLAELSLKILPIDLRPASGKNAWDKWDKRDNAVNALFTDTSLSQGCPKAGQVGTNWDKNDKSYAISALGRSA